MSNSIFKALPIIPHDKLSHFFIGSVLATIGCLFSLGLGIALCFLFAVGKEIYDKVSKTGNPEFLDFVWTVAGGFGVCLISFLA